jgi:hypothetical protein
MERLTGRDAYGDIVANEEMQIIASRGTTYDDLHNIINHLAEKLCEYEDLEEQGRLTKLPCKVGDIVWYADNEIKIESIKIQEKSSIVYQGSSINGGYGKFWFNSSDLGKTVFLTEAEAYAKLDLGVTIGQTLYVIPEDGQNIRKAEVVSINPHYYNDAGVKISEMRNKDYGYYLDIKVRYLDDIHVDLPVTVTFRPKDFEDGIIFTTQEKAEEKLEKLKGELNEERD